MKVCKWVPTLETDRLILRELKPEDADDLRTWLGRDEIYTYWGRPASKGEKNPELLSIVEFDVHVYRQVTINGRKALKLDFYSRRVYGEDIMPFLYNLKETRGKTIAEMITNGIPTKRIFLKK